MIDPGDHSLGLTTPPPAAAIAPGVPWLLFGGSFDPPHRAHVSMPVAARRAVWRWWGPDARDPMPWLILVPAAISPHKPGRVPASGEHRVEMLRLAFDNRDAAPWWICRDELDRAETADEPSYWVQTLERVRASAGPQRDVRFLIGADQALNFHEWREPRRILELARPVVVPRDRIKTKDDLLRGLRDLKQLIRKGGTPPFAWTDDELDRWRDAFVELTPDDASSTRVRGRLSAPSDAGGPLGPAPGPGRVSDVAPALQRYIDAHGLYRQTNGRRVVLHDPQPGCAPEFPSG